MVKDNLAGIGQALARERLRRGLTIEQVSQATYIRKPIISLIEEEKWDELSGGFTYTLLFLKNYAKYLHLDISDFIPVTGKNVQPVIESSVPEIIVPASASKIIILLSLFVFILAIMVIRREWYSQRKWPWPEPQVGRNIHFSLFASDKQVLSVRSVADGYIRLKQGKIIIFEGRVPANFTRMWIVEPDFRFWVKNPATIYATVNGAPLLVR